MDIYIYIWMYIGIYGCKGVRMYLYMHLAIYVHLRLPQSRGGPIKTVCSVYP